MIGNKKVIGLCLTRIQSISVNEYVSCLHTEVEKQGYKLMIFNSPVDFYNSDSYDEGAKAIYRIINYNVIDVLVIYAELFMNPAIVDNIVERGQKAGVPVVILKGTADGCHCIVNDYEDGLKEIINHVICDHGVRDTFFIGGYRENNHETERRIACYKEVLKRNGIDFRDDLVDYGEYWQWPTVAVIKRLFEKRKQPPRAIFCANDYMAITVCKELAARGYRIPEDVIVTGFDGVPEAKHFIPRITTCQEDFHELAKLTIEAIEHAFIYPKESKIYKNVYKPYFAESCGCKSDDMDIHIMLQNQLGIMKESIDHEDFVCDCLERTLKLGDMSDFIAAVPEMLIAESYLCLNRDFITQAMDDKQEEESIVFFDTLEIIPSKYSQNATDRKEFSLSEIVPDGEQWAESDSLYVLEAVFAGSNVYGYYAAKTSNIALDSNKINRLQKHLNIAFKSIIGYYQQRMQMIGLRNAAFIDHTTGLANLEGTTKWFQEYAADPEHHQKPLTVSVYGLPTYKYIYENFGIEEIEKSVCVVAEALKHTNTENCFIGRVSQDEFLVINYYDSDEQISPVINEATSRFFGIMGDHNTRNSKEYYLEVNAGCTEAMPGWEGTLSAFSKLAGNEMYLNRLRAGKEKIYNKTKLPKEYYKTLGILIEKNLFGYHFQPIVDVKSGEIYGYEALMRPDRSIGMNPDEVIRTAQEYSRLYDIEKATMFNVLKIFSERFEEFRNRKLFINSIPGFFLKDDDYEQLIERYSEYIKHIVIEITENSSLSDEELAKLRGLVYGHAPIALDDYGTGHSNIVNLLRYSPQIIKVDRYLITNIQNDTNKQMFFHSTVEFARLNGIKVLAEGVETSEELRCTAKLGADLIQGYYTGRPAPDPLDEIDSKIRKELMELQ